VNYEARRPTRFWSKALRPEKGCWLWQGPVTRKGYGHFTWRKGDSRRAHRAAWELAYGPVPAGRWVLHYCDTPACVRPGHLYIGDHAANTADMIRRGRKRRGEDCHKSGLKNTDIPRIRALVQSGIPKTHVARAYGVSPIAIWMIVQRRHWGHIE